MQSKAEILNALKSFKRTHAHKYGIRSLGIFGSFARDQQDEKSDLDVVVTLKESDYFIIERIKEDLEKLIHREIDVVSYRSSLHNPFKENIERDAIYV